MEYTREIYIESNVAMEEGGSRPPISEWCELRLYDGIWEQ